ncbi:MAG TPA: ATP-binding protein [Burkholderiales bacterium]|nr:ATP-binding protein [Burkholderiales bacterium]
MNRLVDTAPVPRVHDSERWAEPRSPTVGIRRGLWLGGAVLISAMVVFAAYDAAHRRELAIQATQQEVAGLARSLAQQMARSLQTADVIVRDAATDSLVASLRDLRWLLHERLRDRAQAIPYARDVFLVGADGQLTANATRFPVQPASLVGEPYVAAHREEAASGLYISGAFRRADSSGWSIVLSRAVRGSKGEFLGVAAAELDLGYFHRFYEAVALGPGRAVNLFGRDGQLLVHYPDAGAPVGRIFPNSSSLRPQPPGKQAVPPIVMDLVDARREIYAAEPVPGFPMSVGVGVEESVALDAWRTQALHSVVRTGLLCLAVLLLIGLVVRQLRRRERAEEQLGVQRALLDELFESAPEAIVMVDLGESVMRVNREFTRLFGYTADEARGRLLSDLIVPDDLKQESRRIGLSLGQGRHVGKETERVDKAGTRLRVSLLGAPIVTATGQIASYAIFRDISERALAEAEREKLASRLRQAEKLEAIGTMAGGIAHDFNNILAAILGYGDMALSTAAEGGALSRHVGHVMTAAHRAKALVDQILAYSRSARGRSAAVNASAMVGEALDLVRASLPPSIELRPHLEVGKATVIADPTQVHQLVMNLCRNAIDAMPTGGTLGVTLDVLDTPADRQLSHGLLPAGAYVRLCVADTGSGMTPAVLERVFEPFFTTKQAGMGTGLGLALVHGIVTDLGGAIDVSSEPGAGSTFQLYLPRSAAAAMEKEEEKAPLARGRGQCVLLVEDEEPLMLLTEEMLAALNYEPAGFTSAAEALAEFRADPAHFDVVVLDHLMPGMTGTELAAHLRQLRSDIPVVLVSGYTGTMLAHEASLAGISQILTKPLDFRRLAEALARALERAPVD